MVMRRAVAVLVSAALAGAPVSAAAQEAAAGVPMVPVEAPVVRDMSRGTDVDSVLLHGGGVIRGTVAESFPGRHVVIVSAAGERHTIAWDQVLDVRYGGAAAEVPVLTMGPGRPRLHIELKRPATVRLYELTGTVVVASGGWGTSGHGVASARPVCLAPCDKVIDGSGGQSFYFAGDRLMPSRRFTLIDHGGDMTAVVRPGRMGMFVGGTLLTSLGLVPALSGAIFLGIAPRGSSTNLQRTGGVMLGVGVGLLVSGIVMIALGRTRVELYRKMTGAAQRRPERSRL